MADRSSRAGAARTWRNMAGARRSGLSEATIDALIAASLPPGESSRLADRVERLPDPAGALRALQVFRAETGRLPDPSRLPNFLALAGFSPYLASLLIQEPAFLDSLPPGGPTREPRTREDLEEDLARFMQLNRSEEHTSELQSQSNLVCRLLLEKKKK